jgi:hypothetical protein
MRRRSCMPRDHQHIVGLNDATEFHDNTDWFDPFALPCLALPCLVVLDYLYVHRTEYVPAILVDYAPQVCYVQFVSACLVDEIRYRSQSYCEALSQILSYLFVRSGCN